MIGEEVLLIQGRRCHTHARIHVRYNGLRHCAQSCGSLTPGGGLAAIDLKAPADRLWEWMTADLNCGVALDVLYPGRALTALATRVGLSFPGHRIEKIPRGELLDAIRETVRAQPTERKRVLDEMVTTSQQHKQEVCRLRPSEIRRWLRVPEGTEGMRRLLAIVAFGAPPVVRAAERWWRDSLRDASDEGATETDATREFSILAAAMDRTVRPLAEAASVLQDTFTQMRELTKSLQQEETRRTQLLAKQAADATKGHDAVMRELARLQSWTGDQHASLRQTVRDLATAVRALDARTDRFESIMRGLVGQVGAAGVALERGQMTVARRQLAQLRAGARRVGIFVDAVNLSASAREAYACGVRYSALRARGRELGEVTLARAYVAEHPVPEKQAALEAALRRSGFEVRTLALRQLSDGRLKANWDLGMATDVMRISHDLDVIVLCTGDGDFVELVRWLREEGLQVHVVGVASHTSGELIGAADGWIPLGEDALVQARGNGQTVR
jgi:uncharacterized LabA/DUF88 family protein